MADYNDKSYVRGTAGNDDLRANYNDTDGSVLAAGAGDDILRGGRYDDVLIGGQGNDQMFGGAGADQFRFFGNQIDGALDTDRIYDLKFAEGDTLVFGSYAEGTFVRDTGENAFASGTSAILSSWEGVVNAVQNSSNITATRQGAGNDSLVLTIHNGSQTQEIVISNGWTAYQNALAADTVLA